MKTKKQIEKQKPRKVLNYLLIILVLSLSLSLTSTTTLAIDDSPNLQARLLSYDPVPVQPGQYVTAYIQIDNLGSGDAPNAAIRIDDEFPFSLTNAADHEKVIGPIKGKGSYVTDEYIQMWYHLMLNSLRLIGLRMKDKIVLCLDDKKNWRKDIYPEYKANRKKERDNTNVNFDEFFEKQIEFMEAIKYFPYSVIKVEKAEGDDIIGSLAKEFSAVEKVTVVSADKDMKQVIK